MRLLAMACAAAVVFCVTAFGAIVVLTPPAPVASPTPAESAPAPSQHNALPQSEQGHVNRPFHPMVSG